MSDNQQSESIIKKVLTSNQLVSVVTSSVLSLVVYYILNKQYQQEKHKKEELEQRNQDNKQQQKYLEQQSKMQQEHLSRQMSGMKNRYSHIPEKQPRIHKICITGGPCGGKTTGLAYLSEKLKEIYHIPVYVVPEAATLMAKGGCNIRTHEYQTNGAVSFQYQLMQLQMSIEDTYLKMAKIQMDQNNFKHNFIDFSNLGQDVVILMDRGLMDGRAYMNQEQWQTMLDQYNMNEVYLRDKRYDLVLHMVSAADGAPDYYTLGNNQARYESDLQQAKDLDKCTQLAWIGHPQFQIIENRNNQTFQQKLDFLLYNLKKQIGLIDVKDQSYKQILRKFIIDLNLYHNLIKDSNIKVQTFVLQDTYLSDYFYKDEHNGLVRQRIKIRKRGNNKSINNNFCYVYSSKLFKDDKIISKKKNIITAQEYASYLANTDERRKSILIKRTTFFSNSNKYKYYFLDEYKNLDLPLGVLKIKVDQCDIKNRLEGIPNIFKIYKEITGIKAYSSHNVAKNDYYIVQEDKKFFLQQIEQNPKVSMASPMQKQIKKKLFN